MYGNGGVKIGPQGGWLGGGRSTPPPEGGVGAPLRVGKAKPRSEGSSGDDSTSTRRMGRRPFAEMEAKSKNYLYTYYSESPVANLPSGVHFHVYQREKCPSTGREHWQGVLSFNYHINIRQACRKINIKNIHLEATRNLVASVKYCTKLKSRIKGPYIFSNEGLTQAEVIKEAIIKETIDLTLP